MDSSLNPLQPVLHIYYTMIFISYYIVIKSQLKAGLPEICLILALYKQETSNHIVKSAQYKS